MKKIRLDMLLVQKGFFPSREQAQGAIMAGEIFVDEKKITKAGTQVSVSSKIKHTGKTLEYVSRGGLKLKKAIECFNLNFRDKTYFDIGASTGGFTDCALQNGAGKIYAIDVGYGQLDWGLRNNPKIIVMERTNARYLTKADFSDLADIISLDVSFISVTKIIPILPQLLKAQGQVIILIKPQFEAGKDKVGKKGVIKSPDIHKKVIENVIACAEENNFIPGGLTYSPIKGPNGNIEFLLLLNTGGETNLSADTIGSVIQESQKLIP